jgi:hypothetical protein
VQAVTTACTSRWAATARADSRGAARRRPQAIFEHGWFRLSKQLSTLESAGYVEIRKRFAGKRPRTSASLSKAGRQAFEQHVAALQRIIARSHQDGGAQPAAEADHGIQGRQTSGASRREAPRWPASRHPTAARCQAAWVRLVSVRWAHAVVSL